MWTHADSTLAQVFTSGKATRRPADHNDGLVWTLGRLVVLSVLAFVLLVAGGPPGAASCAAGSGPAGSNVIFVGTAEENRRGYTRLTVSEALAGPRLAPEVWVRSGQDQPPWPLHLFLGVSGSTDAELVEGRQYVVGASRQFDTSVCSVVELAAAKAVEPLRTRAEPPTPSGSEGADPPMGSVSAGLVVTGLIAGVAVAGTALRRRLRAREGAGEGSSSLRTE